MFFFLFQISFLGEKKSDPLEVCSWLPRRFELVGHWGYGCLVDLTGQFDWSSCLRYTFCLCKFCTTSMFDVLLHHVFHEQKSQGSKKRSTDPVLILSFFEQTQDCVPRTYPVLTGEELKNCEAFSREFQSWDPWWISIMILLRFPILLEGIRNEGISQSYNLGLPKLCNSGKGL